MRDDRQHAHLRFAPSTKFAWWGSARRIPHSTTHADSGLFLANKRTILTNVRVTVLATAGESVGGRWWVEVWVPPRKKTGSREAAQGPGASRRWEYHKGRSRGAPGRTAQGNSDIKSCDGAGRGGAPGVRQGGARGRPQRTGGTVKN